MAFRSRVVSCAAVAGIAALGVAGCTSDGSVDPVKAAQAQVSQAEKDVESAQNTLTSQTKQFCDSAKRYITALDRYGDVLNQTAPTVADVKDAGSDLAKPQQVVTSAASDAASAQKAVVDAQQNLANAKFTLSAAQASVSGSPTPTATPSPSSVAPVAPAATVNRVKQAQSDFVAAQAGITDQTPLKQASQEFNAAAVALEMSWLQLFSDAGCLTDEQQKQASAVVHDYTLALEKSLTTAGYYDGELDGVYGPAVVDSVKALQTKHGLPVTGTVDKATSDALQADLLAKGGVAAQEQIASVTAVQQTLKLAGYWDGPVDGNWTPALTDALKKFQTDLGVKPTGTVDSATIAALEKAIASGGSSPSPSPSPSSSKSSSPTVSKSASASPSPTAS
jgi:peptidoglycan hydrolase-like protein with peptidoglycan-binding domain